ncbi:MAG: flagellar assembly protein FliW [Bacillota bacterium]|nr:flagellar assembly protein FliW [Bacillota bacterium]MDW7683027.1 flagellar assembly protein FliW [Bacillota bacterium]
MTGSEKTITMCPGLLGFEELTDYTLKPVPGNHFFYWLEAKEEGPSFILTKPKFFFPDYTVQVKRDSLANLCIEETEPEVYLIVTVPEQTSDMTANLLAPLFVNEEKGLACQFVLHDTSYTTKHYLFAPEKRRSCG